MIKLVRCDDRLIHGQCVVRVIADFNIAHIVVADDFVAGNPILTNVFLLAAPSGIKTEILSILSTASRVPELDTEKGNVLLLMRSPEAALKLYEAASGLKQDLNIGPMSNRPNTVKATMYCSLTAAEQNAIKALTAQGIRVYFNQVISQKTIEWADVQHQF